MFRESGDARMNFVLFSYAGKFLKVQSVRVGVINNIWLFIPLGTGLYKVVSEEMGAADPLRDVCGNRNDPVYYGTWHRGVR